MNIVKDIFGDFIREKTQELTTEICRSSINYVMDHLSDFMIDECPRGYPLLNFIEDKEQELVTEISKKSFNEEINYISTKEENIMLSTNKINSILANLMEAGVNAGKEACAMFMEDVNKQMAAYEASNMDNENWVMTKEVYMDTCSLMHPGADKFFFKYVPLFEKYGKKFNTLSCCIREIEKHLTSDNDNTRYLAQKAKSNIDRLIEAGLLNVVDYSDDVFADGDFAAVFVKKRIKEEILFITQDGDLSIDIYNLNEMRSIKGHEIIVQALDYDGDVVTNPKLAEYLGVGEADEDFEYSEEYDNAYFVDNAEYNYESELRPTHTSWDCIEYNPMPNYEVLENMVNDPSIKVRTYVNGMPVSEMGVAEFFNNLVASMQSGQNAIISRGLGL